MKQQLIFIYNADSSPLSQLIDYGKKFLGPNVAACELCTITFGVTGLKKDWKQFIASLDADVRIIHRDEFAAEFPDVQIKHPSLYSATTGKNLLEQADFKGITTVQQLQEKVTKVL